MPTALTNASFNVAGADGYPAIVPATDALLIRPVVLFRSGPMVSADRLYQLPGLAGEGVQTFPPPGQALFWTLSFNVSSMANLRAFEDKLRRYRTAPGNLRWPLASELPGQTYPYCRLRSWRFVPSTIGTDQDRVSAGDLLLYTLDIEFRDMQPRSGV